jgi:hypothetical protein
MYTEEVADVAETFVRQGPPEEQERATWTLRTLACQSGCMGYVGYPKSSQDAVGGGATLPVCE